jgi:hypothetical protein
MEPAELRADGRDRAAWNDARVRQLILVNTFSRLLRR